MKIVQRKQLLLVGVTATILGSTGCKKYPEGPAFSLKSKKARLIGNWELREGPSQIVNNTEDVFYEFEDDGGFTNTSVFNYAGSTNSYSFDGEWEFSSDKEELEIQGFAGRVDYEILRLTSEELFLEDPSNNEYELEKQ